jgi:glycerophosphoryl diester phosphodiesterase
MVDAFGSRVLTDMITAQSPPNSMRQPDLTLEAIAHRGVRDRYPENSIPAFVAALDAGADAIELDVLATRDGVVVVHHDANLPASSSALLAGRAIAAVEGAELATFELTPGVGLPTLEETLLALVPRAKVYIEIKVGGIEALVAGVLARIPSAETSCAVHSFDHRIVQRFRLIAPAIPTGILLVGYPVDSASLLTAATARDLWQSCDLIDRDLVASIHRAGGRVIAWTCNDPREWRRLSELGVDGICTDRIAALVEWIRNE